MPIPSPGVPSATSSISSVELQTTNNNKAFYIYSGEVEVDSSETTMISVNDIGKRDIIFCLEVGSYEFSSVDTILRIKSNGQLIYNTAFNNTFQGYPTGHDEIKLILPANTSLEITIQAASGTDDWTIAGYGYYLD